MMTKPNSAVLFGRLGASLVRFRDDERGSMTLIILFTFLVMIMFGGIAVDVMRFETRRVALQQTLDRAVLAAASLTQTKTPKEVVDDWFLKAGLQEELLMVKYADPTVTAIADVGLRRVTVSAEVRSYNYFMSIYSPNDYLEGPTVSEAAQGVSEIEIMLVLDITGSMNEPAGMADDPLTTTVNEASTTKIQSLRTSAQDFVTIVKGNDKKNGISIGVVPYAAQVNIPAALRGQFTVQNVSSWNNIANAGVPDINCIEIPTSTFTSVGLSRTSPMKMYAVADGVSGTTTTTNFVTAATGAPVAGSRACSTLAENPGTAFLEAKMNHLMLPTKNPVPVNAKLAGLVAGGNTAIALGMRWGTALIDESARPIYTAIGDSSVAGRPYDNNSVKARKIIVLMTDGDHVTNVRVLDAYKTGLSPIWRGADGNMAIRYTALGTARTNGARPTAANACSG